MTKAFHLTIFYFSYRSGCWAPVIIHTFESSTLNFKVHFPENVEYIFTEEKSRITVTTTENWWNKIEEFSAKFIFFVKPKV